MSMSKIEKNITESINKHEKYKTERLLKYQKAIERYNGLEKKGFVKKRGNSLLPIEERYKLVAEYRK